MFTLTFLGTSSGVPTKARNVTGLAVTVTGTRDWFLIDCGEATQHQLLRTPHSVRDLAAICITHVHGDHCYGVPGLLACAAMQERRAPLAMIAPAPALRWIQATIDYTALYLPYELRLLGVADVTDFDIAGCRIATHALSHRVPCHAFSITRSVTTRKIRVDALKAAGVPQGPDWKRLQAGEDLTLSDGRTIRAADFVDTERRTQRIVVAGDNDRPELLTEACASAQLLVHESTYSDAGLERAGPDRMHSSAGRVARFATKAGLRNLILTHFSPRYDAQGAAGLAELEHEARAAFHGNLFLARDFERYELKRDGNIVRLTG